MNTLTRTGTRLLQRILKALGADKYMWCKHCGPDYPLRVEMREELGSKPRAWAVCDNCGRELRGKLP